MLVLIAGIAGSAGGPTLSAGASSSSKDSYFGGTLTVTEHLVWNYSVVGLSEHGQRDITGQVKLKLVVLGSRVVSFKATRVTVNGTMHLVEKIRPSSCNITTTHTLDSKGAFVASGSLGDLALTWPMVDHQVDVGTCTGEPQGTNDFDVTWGSAGIGGLNTGDCTTKDVGAKGPVVYDSTYKPPFGTEGVGSATTATCKGELKKTARP
jgi:hypothetical protein